MNMVWTFTQTERMFQEIEMYADKMGQIGLFFFTVDERGVISGNVPDRMTPSIAKWRNVTWLLTIQNINTSTSVVNALIKKGSTANITFLNQIKRILKENPLVHGIDIDLENCGGYENRDGMKTLIYDIYTMVHSLGKKLNVCFPPITGDFNSIGGEYWCAYGDYTSTCDTASIMSYGMSWLGSAPGPVSPKYWLDNILDYAVTKFNRNQLLIGIGAWAFMWAIHKKFQGYGAESFTYYGAINWLYGDYTFDGFSGENDIQGKQSNIPFCGFWDDVDKICSALPHVYDYVNANHYTSIVSLVMGDFNNKKYLTSYSKYTDSTGIEIRQETPSNINGAVYQDGKYISLRQPQIAENEGSFEYEFYLPIGGIYDIAMKINFAWFDRNSLNISIDEKQITFVESRYWNPKFRKESWYKIFNQLNLSKGRHVIRISSANRHYGIVCSGIGIGNNILIPLVSGNASYTMSTRELYSTDGKLTKPVDGLAGTIELLQREPDSAMIWYDDFRDYGTVRLANYYDITGNFSYNKIDSINSVLGSGSMTLKNSSFNTGEVYCRIIKTLNQTGRVGCTFGRYWCCVNFINNSLELYEGNSILKTYECNTENSEFAISMRVRKNSIRVYWGTNKSLLFTLQGTFQDTGSCGIKCDNESCFFLFRLGDGWTYEPYEAVKLTVNRKEHILGRKKRTGVTWDNELQVFKLNTDINEIETRDEIISMDYTFDFCGVLPVDIYDRFEVVYEPIDINVWFANYYVGDSNGFGIMYYQDADVLSYWNNRARHTYGILGSCVWSLGQEDARLWDLLPKCV